MLWSHHSETIWICTCQWEFPVTCYYYFGQRNRVQFAPSKLQWNYIIMGEVFKVEKMTRKGIFSNCWLHWHVRDRLPTWENVGKNPVPSCAGSSSGPDRRRAGQDCCTGCWPAWWISSPRPDWPKSNSIRWTINPNKGLYEPPKKGLTWCTTCCFLDDWLTVKKSL